MGRRYFSTPRSEPADASFAKRMVALQSQTPKVELAGLQGMVLIDDTTDADDLLPAGVDRLGRDVL